MIDDLLQSNKNRTIGRAFSPFKRCDNFTEIEIEDGDKLPGAPSLSIRTPKIKEEIYCNGFSLKSSSSRSGSSSATNSRSNFNTEHQQSGGKQRWCWSPELHRRFVSALQQLGGAQEISPHSRRVPLATNTPSIQPSGILGGLWMSEEQRSESSKPSKLLLGSPQNLLQLTGSYRDLCV